MFVKSVENQELATIDYFISCELFTEIMESLDFLHSLSPPIIHRDIKPENILVFNHSNKRFVKLCDFGFAKHLHFSGQSNTRDKGTVSYMAPEVGQSKVYDSKSDVYSVGLIGHKLFGVEFDRYLSVVWLKSQFLFHQQLGQIHCKEKQRNSESL